MKEDQAQSAILELVDGPRDLHFVMTAKTLAGLKYGAKFTPAVENHIKKATQFRKNGMEKLAQMVERMRSEQENGVDNRILAAPRSVYPTLYTTRELRYYEDVDHYKDPNPLPKGRFQSKNKKQALPNPFVEGKQIESPEPLKASI